MARIVWYNAFMRWWVFERQAVGFTIVTVLVLTLLAFGIAYIRPNVSCSDRIKNGDEEEVDCGGSCPNQCLGGVPKPPEQIWSRVFPARLGGYDAAAFVVNPNFQAGSRDVRYSFKLYDKDNIRVGLREGRTFLYPNQETLFFEPSIDTGNRVPVKSVFVIENIKWERVIEKEGLNLEVVKKDFSYNPNPSVTLTIANRSLFDEPALEVSVLLEGADGATYAASRTIVEQLPGESSRNIVFTWPGLSLERPLTIRPLYRRVLR